MAQNISISSFILLFKRPNVAQENRVQRKINEFLKISKIIKMAIRKNK